MNPNKLTGSISSTGKLIGEVTKDSPTILVEIQGTGAKGEKGDQGESGVYVGSGDMPESYNVQIDPNGDGETLQDMIDSALLEAKNSGDFKGDTGERGLTGEIGLTGEKGDTGAKGEKGEKGDKGDKGEKGANGKDGENGTNGKDGYTPVKGTDYFTEGDKAEIVAAVKAQLVTEQWTFTLTDDTSVTKEVLVE